ncbi:hypothetical protein HF086_011964 [Spodoptera exigua]|uniref:Peptidase S1 domain-containing protein n=1 Tax=Spodoptera exigua TaxID=7107 RepID=A0A922M7J5_SPOEX|nr:hypothetical protein HF086_011964 [Spodoptera exigua]
MHYTLSSSYKMFWLLLFLYIPNRSNQVGIVGNPLAHARPCDDNTNVTASFESGLPPGEENQYYLNIRAKIQKHSQINLKFDSDATVTLVFEIILHKDFDPKTLNNDIALLKLKSEALFDDYVQPACLWQSVLTKKLPSGGIYGSVRTSACNGDSGGGLVIFVPDVPGTKSQESGAWHVRGVVSTTVSRTDAPICDPNQYTLFTDVAKYRKWILSYLD